jgi:OOP family OmpA-OmpF porin
MKHIFVRAPAVAALFLVACAGSQKNLTDPQKAALKAEEHAQDAQNDAQKARVEASKSQQELFESQQAHEDARRAEIDANQRAQQASYAAGRAEQQAGMAAHTAGPPPGPPPSKEPPKGATEAQGSNAAHEAPAKVVVITSGLLFASNSADLSAGSKPKLDDLATVLRKQPDANLVIVEGHTDDIGHKAGNMKLSQQRAQAVADYLERQGVPKDRVQTKALGSQDPASPGKTAEARALNRRVDISVQPAAGP